MPVKKRQTKKNPAYWLKKWIRKASFGLITPTRRFQPPPPDIVFLTSEEVKTSLAKLSMKETDNYSSESPPRPDLKTLPPNNRLRGTKRNDKTLLFKLKRLFKRITFGSFKKKHTSSATHHRSHHNRLHDNLASADVKFHKLAELSKINADSSLQDPYEHHEHRHHHHRVHNHGRRYHKGINYLKQILIRFRKKSVINKDSAINRAKITTERIKVEVPWTHYIKPTLTSTAIFMVAYQLSWLFYQLAVMVTASFFGIDSVLYYYEVMFPVGSNALIWTPEKIIIITLSGPFLALVAWTLLRLILHLKIRYGPHFRLFLVWMYLVSMMLFFGAFVGGAITLEGFGYVIDWLFLSISLRLIFSLIFIALIIAISWNVIRLLPESTRSHSWKSNRYKFVLSKLIIPWFLGGGLMILLKITNQNMQHEHIFDYDTINLATLLFAVVPSLFNVRTRPKLISTRKVNTHFKRAIPFLWMGGAIILVILFRIVLSYGVYFRMIFEMNLHFYN